MDDTPTEHPGSHVLDETVCWDLLRAHEFGRLAFHLGEQVHIVPVNYAVDHDTLLFRTAEGSKLLAVAMEPDVAFEIDEYDEHTARSVVVRGRARLLAEHEEVRAENVPLRPWVSGDTKFNVVEIVPTEVTGRRFDLAKPWTHLRA